MKKISKKKNDAYDKIVKNDSEKWDSRELGNDEAFAEKSPQFKETPKFKNSTVQTTFRLSLSMIAELKKIADEEGIPYQTLVKSVLKKFIDTKKSA